MRILALIGCLIVLSGCTGLVLAEGASIVATDKGLEDHLVSLASGKDCSGVRRETGRTYCEEDEANPAPTLYCYRTLANVTCYHEPDPHRGRQINLSDGNRNAPTNP